MNKITSLSFIGLLVLTGCFGSSEPLSEKTIEGFHLYQTEVFSIQVPDGWETLTRTDFGSQVPPNTLVVFRDNVRNPIFVANVAVLKNTLGGETNSLDYAKALRDKLEGQLNSYREIAADEEDILIAGNETPSLFIAGEGRETPEDDLKHFFQFSGVKGTEAYVALGSMLETSSEDLQKKAETMVKSFAVK